MISEESKRLVAAQYVLTRVTDWVNDIRAASYPHTPESYGPQYTYFVETLDRVKELLEDES